MELLHELLTTNVGHSEAG